MPDSIFISYFSALSRTVSLPFCHLWCLFGCWVLFVYCFQMADADFICVAFKFQEIFLQPWLKRLSCFLSPVFMVGPLKWSNWKQLSLPVLVLSRRKCLFLCVHHLDVFITAVYLQRTLMFLLPLVELYWLHARCATFQLHHETFLGG